MNVIYYNYINISLNYKIFIHFLNNLHGKFKLL